MPAGRPKKDPTDEDLLAIKVLDQYKLGKSAEEIARGLHCDHWTVHAAIRKAAEECRANLREEIEEAFLAQKLGLEHLVQRCMEQIERAAVVGGFDANAVKSLILVYDRQAKLLALDKSHTAAGKDQYAWMQGASESELRRQAAARGIRLPESIVDA